MLLFALLVSVICLVVIPHWNKKDHNYDPFLESFLNSAENDIYRWQKDLNPLNGSKALNSMRILESQFVYYSISKDICNQQRNRLLCLWEVLSVSIFQAKKVSV